MNFPYLLFDADDTLFDFPKAAARALSLMCRAQGLPDSPELYRVFHSINTELWDAFNRGEIAKESVLLERFARLLGILRLDRDPSACNRDFTEALGQAVFPLPHAEAVCRTLAGRGHRLFIITNATASVQRRRLKTCSFADVFSGVFISEDAGTAKPDRAFYDYVRSQLPGLTERNALAIGDSLTSDIRGANNAGLPCCWFNPGGTPLPEGFRVDYEISDLRELMGIA